MIKRKTNIISEQIQEKDNSLYVFGWCVMASEQNTENNLVVIYNETKKPERNSKCWSNWDTCIYYGPCLDKTFTEGRTSDSEPMLIKMKVEKV